MGPVLVAGRDDVLGKGWPRQIITGMRVRQDAGPLGRGDLESGVAEPLDQNRGFAHGRRSENARPDYFHLMAETQSATGHEEPSPQDEEHYNFAF